MVRLRKCLRKPMLVGLSRLSLSLALEFPSKRGGFRQGFGAQDLPSRVELAAVAHQANFPTEFAKPTITQSVRLSFPPHGRSRAVAKHGQDLTEFAVDVLSSCEF